MRCANGAVLDVVVDARRGSATFGQVMTFLLDDQVCTQVYIPRGFLHGFQALTAVTDVVYRIDEFHAPNSDVTVRHDDPDLAIPWPAPATIMSARDRENGNQLGGILSSAWCHLTWAVAQKVGQSHARMRRHERLATPDHRPAGL